MSQEESKEFTLRIKVDGRTHPLLYDALKDLTSYGRCDRMRLLAQQGLLVEQLGISSEHRQPRKSSKRQKRPTKATTPQDRPNPQVQAVEGNGSEYGTQPSIDLPGPQTNSEGATHRALDSHRHGNEGDISTANEGNSRDKPLDKAPTQPPEVQERSMRLMQMAGALTLHGKPGSNEG